MLSTRLGTTAVVLVLASHQVCFAEEKERTVLKADRSWTVAVAFSPDGKRLVSGGGHQANSYLWDVATEKPIAKIDAGDLVNSVAFSADGRLIVTVALDTSKSTTRIKIWNGVTGKAIGEIPVDLGTEAAISPDGKVLVTVNLRRMGIQFYRLPDGQQIGELPHPTVHGSQNAVQVSPNRSSIAAGYDKGIWVGNSSSGETQLTFEAASDLKALVFSPDSRLLVTAGEDGTVQCWNLAQGKPAWSQKKHTKQVDGLAMAATGTAVASAGGDSTVRIWNPLNGEVIRVIDCSGSGATSVAFSPDCKTLAIGNGGGVALWDVQVPAPSKTSAPPKKAARKKGRN